MKALFRLLGIVMVLAAFVACTQNDDGPLNISSSKEEFSGSGYFRKATLDSSAKIHLVDDTLFLRLDSVWAFSNCAKLMVKIDWTISGTVAELRPHLSYKHDSSKDCASPYIRPDTTIKLLFSKANLESVSKFVVINDEERRLDSIYVRRGSFKDDTTSIYVDTVFNDVHKLPLRTKGSPSLLKVLDSLVPNVYYWRTMASKCTLVVTPCDSLVADTIYPTTWRLSDTTLVPIRHHCADTSLTYCSGGRWKNDSTDVSKILERPDTNWYTHNYIIQNIPSCGTLNSFSINGLYLGNGTKVIEQVFVPSEEEPFCGPASGKDWNAYDLNAKVMVADTSVVADTLYATWRKATVAPISASSSK